MSSGFKVAVVGATGAVGREMMDVLEKRKFPVSELVPFASARSEGKPVRLQGKSYPCQVLKKGCFSGVKIAFFDASDAISKEWVPQAVEAGAWVVDNSSTFRLEKDIPLIVPEVNSHELDLNKKVIAGPNCSTVQTVVALKPIQQKWGIRRLVISTYQSTSGAGTLAIDELRDQTRDVLAGKKAKPEVFPHPIAFNCIPQIGGFKVGTGLSPVTPHEEGYTSEELKMMAEIKKILGLPGLKLTATAVRVPTLSCHAVSVNIECERPFGLREVREALAAQPGLVVQDDPSKGVYPLGTASAGQDPVYVGRIRRDSSIESGLNLWVVSDNLRKGAALNAVQIGEVLLPHLARASGA